ncbi:hypothetical protein [Haloferula sp. A504]|uniref:hypothetical protein n=1 Tax=Haloferula sp. A504 TaxID=3373601 RepID=UPI0031C19885|nr:hypothetical protein [Verrucomicrobiaceae bacterium E54]
MSKALLLLWLLLASPLAGQAVLEPPFGLKWGDSPERLLTWADRHKLDIHIDLPAKAPAIRIFRIDRKGAPLPDSPARAVEARFHDGRLIEVTVHYGMPGDKAETVEADFNRLKRELGKEHGNLSANQQERSVEDNFSTRTLSFHREPVRGLFLLMAFTEIEDLLRKSRRATFSVIYRNDNLRIRLENAARPSGGPSLGE